MFKYTIKIKNINSRIGVFKMDFDKISKEIICNIGGRENIKQIGHCATRLRISVYDAKKVNDDALSKLDGPYGYVFKNDQAQLIFGGNVVKAYNSLVEVTGFEEEVKKEKEQEKNSDNGLLSTTNIDLKGKNFSYYVDVVGGFFAEIFMPIVPALITGGVILSLNNLLINYFGIEANSGTAQVILALFSAAFSMLPVYLGFTIARKLKLSPILGAFLGAVLINPSISGIEGLDFLGIPITTVDYSGSVLPVILGVIFMYYVDKVMDKYIPEFGKYLLKPMLTMFIVVPITLIILGPIGTLLSEYVGQGILWLMNTLGFIAMPILSALYPYMVMFGIDKATMPIGFQAVETLGYDPIIMVMGFISNLCVGASALAISFLNKENKERQGAYFSFGLTGLFGITEPAFYGALIGRPKALLGTAIGAATAGLFAGIFGLKSYVMGGAPGLFTLLFFLNPDGTFGNMLVALSTAVIAISVSYIATTVLLKKGFKQEVIREQPEMVDI